MDLIIEQERTRIARDLHDVLAHSPAVIAAQADGTRYLSKDQPKAVLNALENIATSARSALVDAQRVIEGVRDDGLVTPQPRLSDVEPLVERMQDGLSIDRSATGVPVELSAGQQLAVFRIVQECLTNALKHGGRGTAVRLHLDRSGPGLTLHVASVAVTAALAAAAASGYASSSGNGEPPCLPPAFSVNPSSAKAGDSVNVTDAVSAEVVNTTAPMNDAGGFTYTFEVPAQAAAGAAVVTAFPYNIDWCDDTGKNNRAGDNRAAGAAVSLQRASCVMPMKPLSITS